MFDCKTPTSLFVSMIVKFGNTPNWVALLWMLPDARGCWLEAQGNLSQLTTGRSALVTKLGQGRSHNMVAIGCDYKYQDIYVQNHLAGVTQRVIVALIPRFGSFKSCQGMT